MPTLMGLPNEILIFIIEATDPEDIESFSTCCKLIYSLARHRLEEHKEKKRLFSKIFVEDHAVSFSEAFRGEGYVKSNLYLKEFFSDQRNCLYPKAMDVRLLTNGNEYDDNPTARMSAINSLDEVEPQLDSRMAEVHSMIGLEIGGFVAEEWGKHVKAGYSRATFLLLLALFPNLEQFSVDVWRNWPRNPSANYSKIMRLMTEAALEQKGNGLSFGGRLSDCTFIGTLREGFEESLLLFFMMLPRMRRIYGVLVKMENCSWPYADAVSPVEDLELHGAIDAVTLSNYIRGIRELKRFSFTYACGHGISWEPCGIVATLRQFASRSLVDLDLTTGVSAGTISFNSSPGIGTLRSFEVLETVRLDYGLLLEEVRTADSADEVNLAETSVNPLDNLLVKGQKLVNFLPSSVRVFELEDIAEGGHTLDTFEGFTDDRVERLPSLRLVKLDAGDETNSQIEKMCKEAGVLWIKSGEE